MRTILLSAALLALASAAPVSAEPRQPAPSASERAKTEYADTYRPACFGAARAWYAEMLAHTDTPNGYYISERKGSNPDIDALYIEQNCAR